LITGENAWFENWKVDEEAMAVSIIASTDGRAKEVVAAEFSSKDPSVNEKSQSTWQMVLQYKTKWTFW
jgi:hypothetical protein